MNEIDKFSKPKVNTECILKTESSLKKRSRIEFETENKRDSSPELNIKINFGNIIPTMAPPESKEPTNDLHK